MLFKDFKENILFVRIGHFVGILYFSSVFHVEYLIKYFGLCSLPCFQLNAVLHKEIYIFF